MTLFLAVCGWEVVCIKATANAPSFNGSTAWVYYAVFKKQSLSELKHLKEEGSIWHYLQLHAQQGARLLPNTAACFSAEEAICRRNWRVRFSNTVDQIGSDWR